MKENEGTEYESEMEFLCVNFSSSSSLFLFINNIIVSLFSSTRVPYAGGKEK